MEQKRPTLKILVGNIASGKSTYCKKHGREPNTVVFNDDNLCYMLHGGQHYYDRSLFKLYKNCEKVLVEECLLLGCSIIIDRPNMSVKTRNKYIEHAKGISFWSRPTGHRYEVMCVQFPMESIDVHAKRRFESDNRGLSLDAWKRCALRHQREYEKPSLDEGFDEIITYEHV